MLRVFSKNIHTIQRKSSFNPILDELKRSNSQLEALNDHMKGVNSRLDAIISEFKGFSTNIARSNEEEIVECVYNHLVDQGISVSDVSKAQKVRENGRILCELDGIITTEKQLVIVEVKSAVGSDAIVQLEKACKIVEQREGMPVIGYLGGPAFDKKIKRRALQSGFGVVELSGDRYRVIDKDSNDEKHYG